LPREQHELRKEGRGHVWRRGVSEKRTDFRIEFTRLVKVQAERRIYGRRGFKLALGKGPLLKRDIVEEGGGDGNKIEEFAAHRPGACRWQDEKEKK